MLINLLYIVIGIVLLVKGGDFLIDGAAAIAKRAKLSNMVIGLTVIGFGTSAPELIVSAQAAFVGSSGIAMGNVVGSDIADIALILGITAMIFPIPASTSTLRRDAPFMLFAVALLVGVGMYGTISRLAGLVFFLLLIGFVWWQVRESRKNPQLESEDTAVPMVLWKASLLVIVSIAALVLGANVLVDGAKGIASSLGVPERVIGLTVVAVGTSLPELFATAMAARKHQTDMALGNIIGSVTFNNLCVIGVSAMISPIGDTNAGFAFDYLVLGTLSFGLLFFLNTKRLLERWEGLVLLIIYAAYIFKTIV